MNRWYRLSVAYCRLYVRLRTGGTRRVPPVVLPVALKECIGKFEVPSFSRFKDIAENRDEMPVMARIIEPDRKAHSYKQTYGYTRN